MDELIAQWRIAEDMARSAADLSEKCKQEVMATMSELDIKKYESELGKVSLVETTKCNFVVDRKEFETTLKNKGMYDKFCTTKFDLLAVKKYAEAEDDDIFGMVELETTASPRFTSNRSKMNMEGQ